jgi:hypothetical protein
MSERKWFTIETTFVGAVGLMLALVLGSSFFVRGGSTTGSSLIPASLLAEMRHAPIAALEAQQAAADEDE